MSRLDRLAARDGWTCWLCERAIDRDAPPGSPGAATADHVVPRSRGGSSDLGNLRLAHRRCNGARANDLPELDWPERFAAIDAAPLWQTLARLVRKGGSEVVALVPTAELAEEAATWVAVRAERFLGGAWTTEVAPAGMTSDACTVRLALVKGSGAADPGRPMPRS